MAHSFTASAGAPALSVGETHQAFPLAQVEVLSVMSHLGTQAIEQTWTQESEFKKINHFSVSSKTFLATGLF